MSPEQQRIAIAEACGWTDISDRPAEGGLSGKTALCVKRHANYYIQIPNYINDLNAMNEAEGILTEDQQFLYCELLANNQRNKILHTTHWHKISATAEQRAKTFLKTLGLWKD